MKFVTLLVLLVTSTTAFAASNCKLEVPSYSTRTSPDAGIESPLWVNARIIDVSQQDDFGACLSYAEEKCLSEAFAGTNRMGRSLISVSFKKVKVAFVDGDGHVSKVVLEKRKGCMLL